MPKTEGSGTSAPWGQVPSSLMGSGTSDPWGQALLPKVLSIKTILLFVKMILYGKKLRKYGLYNVLVTIFIYQTYDYYPLFHILSRH